MENNSPFPLSVHRAENPATKARRLLEELNSPLLQLASQLHESSHPHLSDSLRLRSVATEVEKVSRGRFTLARDQPQIDGEWSRSTRLKVIHNFCQHYSRLSIAQLEALGGTEKCCCYCSEPLSLDHIGRDLAEIQRFVEIRSGGKVRFSDQNCIEGFDISDVFLFDCLTPCRGLEYDLPFIWFLRDSMPGNSPDHTCGCPCCTAMQKK